MNSWFQKTAFDFDDWLKDARNNNFKTDKKIEIERDVQYASDEVCKLDLYIPKIDENQKHIVLVNIHGGGWITGDKHKRRGVSMLYADMGLLVVNINYGMSPQYKYHHAVKHCYQALQWVYDNADKYNIDTHNLFVTGDSAGGQLACLILATQNNMEFRHSLDIEDCEGRFRSGILCCGAYDIDAMARNPLASSIIQDMTDKKPKELDTYPYYAQLRTLDWVDENFPQDVIITYGKLDAFVGGHERGLIQKLDQLDKRYFLYGAPFPGDHCYHLYYHRKIARVFFDMVREYFDQIRANDKVVQMTIPQ